MEEKKKGMSPILIVILTIIGTCLVGFCVWYGVNYFKGEKSSSSGNETNNISNDKIQLYNSLTSNNGGFYFNKSVSINDISTKEFLEYVFGMYVKENNFTLSYDLDCITDDGRHYGDCSDVKVPFASKETIDSYIKNKFNTEKIFTLSADDKFAIGQLSSLEGNDLGDYVYAFANKTYYFGRGARGSRDTKIYRKLSDVKEDNENISFYDKAIYLETDAGGNYIFNSVNNYDKNEAIFEFNDIYNGKKYNEVTLSTNGDIVLNEDYVFDKYADKLNTYKHTFKKVNGNYYWVSSEIVK